MEIGLAAAVAAARSRSTTTAMNATEIRFVMSAPFAYFVTVNVCDAEAPVSKPCVERA
jgi:hypothetical protein